MPTPEERLAALGLTLPEVAAPVANYAASVRSGNLVYVSGQLSRALDGKPLTGRLGDDMTVEVGYEAARSAALFVIAVLKATLGDLERVAQVVRLEGMVQATPDFEAHPQVVNGASDLFVAVFADRGRHARAAFGVASLPLGAAVEIEATVEVTG